ncbi:hypothetical protein Xen7305DRAFT_00025390 [Xenococcus sp. PCC 7305]|uniref:hypothetical protein n=1 Tax=Xenococcus sp. PCC 7305 TaxID=102125 RepID=UPI0002ACFA27|nr:hypothetical protein [Xenococcus sp. PCC 7305]ELS02821.1 hypothetical protein Xen7305DRAFT_00025390 [Xenococcus sp. PCC 7305]
MFNSQKISLSILGLITAIYSNIFCLPAQAFVVNFSNLDDLDDSSAGETFPPNSIDEGNFQDEDIMFFFTEQTGLNLISDLSVDANVSGTFNRENANPGLINAGTLIDSYYFSFDIPNDITNSASDVIEIEFSQPILGIIFLTSSLNNTDSVLGRTGIDYPTNSNVLRGVESDPGITWDNDNLNLSAQLRVNNNNSFKVDHFRVVTAADIPFEFSPTSGLILVFGIVFLSRILPRVKQ